MQVSRLCCRLSRTRSLTLISSRAISSIPRPTPPPSVVPWFLDQSEPSAEESIRNPSDSSHVSPSIAGRPSLTPHPPLPDELPSTSVLAQLYDLLKTSPHLEPGTLLVREPIPTPVGPPLPAAAPKGRRQRGRTYFGEGVTVDGLESGGLWNWIMVVQVKEGTEKRGSIESVVRLVRKALLTANPPLTVPHSSKRKVSDGWAMLDAGDFAVHILSGEAREKFFPEKREW
ncbi:hypothetical protein QCA50_007803 [Cerrena zonata]|uniref:Uncharacterized protein n=1 Tax=Cerrena zonata TaxID=2478898 RepID=A0AAW0GGM8_9APHY